MTSGRTRALLALAAPLGLVFSAWNASAGDAHLARATDAATVVVSYTETPGELADAEGGPVLRIYGDGRVEVHYPRYMKKAGDWEARLGANEVDTLVTSLADKGVLDVDADALRRARRDAAASRRQAAALRAEPQTFEVVADADTTTIEVNLSAKHKKIAWHGLREDARQYPEVAGIQGLAAAGRELRAVMERGDLRKVR